MQSVARCLQMMLRIDEYRIKFIDVEGLSTLLSVLSGRVNFQIQYQLIFCIWVLTFNSRLAERMNKYVSLILFVNLRQYVVHSTSVYVLGLVLYLSWPTF